MHTSNMKCGDAYGSDLVIAKLARVTGCR